MLRGTVREPSLLRSPYAAHRAPAVFLIAGIGDEGLCGAVGGFFGPVGDVLRADTVRGDAHAEGGAFQIAAVVVAECVEDRVLYVADVLARTLDTGLRDDILELSPVPEEVGRRHRERFQDVGDVIERVGGIVGQIELHAFIEEAVMGDLVHSDNA